MSGLLALLDDVAAIAKLAAASVDDIAAAAAKAGTKAAGVVIDDAAVTPKYVHGFSADRELPIIWRIALGSMKNKLLILLPALLALDHFLGDGDRAAIEHVEEIEQGKDEHDPGAIGAGRLLLRFH